MSKTNFGYFNDKVLAKRIRERIRWDKRVSDSDIQIVARYGHVILKGIVDCPFRKEAALEIAANTEGVTSINNQIISPTYFHRLDSELKVLIEEKISSFELMGTESITVSVENGHVKLEGVVHSPRKKALAAGVAWELSGVTDCDNMIDIVGQRSRSFLLKSPSMNNTFLVEKIF